MGTHPIFESDFDCLTDKMNRLLTRPVVQLARRPLISSAETDGHSWYRSGFTAFSSHPTIYRYLGLGLMGTAFVPTYVLFMDYLYDDRKLQAPIEEALVPEGLLRDALNISLIVFTIGCIQFHLGRILAFQNLNIGHKSKQLSIGIWKTNRLIPYSL